jgi:hypothetical protein
MKKVLAVFAAALVAATVAHAGEGPIKEGLWEVTTKMDMPGMPSMASGMTVKHCYTKKDVEQAAAMIPKNNNCKVTNFKQSGNKASWAMQCTGPSAMNGTGEMSYGPDSYQGTVTMQGQGMNMIQHISARRLGECK